MKQDLDKALDQVRDDILTAIARQGVTQARMDVRLENVEIAMREQVKMITAHRELVGQQAQLHAGQSRLLGQIYSLGQELLATLRRVENRLALSKRRRATDQ